MDTQQCFHCGTLLRGAYRIGVEVAGERHWVCCAGCQTVLEGFVAYSVNQIFQGEKIDDTDRNHPN
ncbi:MAG: heavy metal translocating P-type ATPase metal-binding domain-containing protein [Thiothrix sp.]